MKNLENIIWGQFEINENQWNKKYQLIITNISIKICSRILYDDSMITWSSLSQNNYQKVTPDDEQMTNEW
jgi:hypothetical protein